MPRKRMIDPGMCESEQVSKLTFRQRCLFVGLIIKADDESRLKGSAAYVKSTVFPYDDIPVAKIEEDLKCIEAAKREGERPLIVRYEVNGVWYICLPGWGGYQSIRKDIFHPSRLPAPPCRVEPATAPSQPRNEPVTDPSQPRNEPVTDPLQTRNEPVTLKQQQDNPNQNNTKQPKADEVLFKESFKLLLDAGVARAKASFFADHIPYRRIENVCRYARMGKNPPGLIIKALEKDWKVPK